MTTARSGLLIGLLISSSMLMGCASTDAESEVAEQEEEVESEEARRARLRRQKTTMPVGHVKFSVKNADLKDEVLPLIEKQAGVRIIWTGSARRVKRLRFSEPVHWEDALALVCQFTNTHLTRDYQGRRVLRHGYSGTLESDAKLRSGSGGGGPQAGRRPSSLPSRSRGGSGGSRRPGATTWENTYGGSPSNSSGDTAKRLLKGTTTRRSGGR